MPFSPWKLLFRIAAVSFSILILLMAFWTRPVLSWLDQFALTQPITYAVSIVFLSFGFIFFWARRKVLTLFHFACLAIIITIYWAIFRTLFFPIEKFHFMNFSVLVILFQLSVPEDWAPWEHYFWPASLTLLVGALDEFLQLWIPNRWGDSKDVWYCLASIILGLALHLSIGFRLPKKS